jgi:hypothetical protein
MDVLVIYRILTDFRQLQLDILEVEVTDVKAEFNERKEQLKKRHPQQEE